MIKLSNYIFLIFNLCILISYNYFFQDLTAAIISPCGGYIAAGSVGGEIFLWEGRRQLLVGFYKDPKKIGICRMAWHSLGCHILFSDRVGRMGILTGIEDAIIKPPPVDQEARGLFIEQK